MFCRCWRIMYTLLLLDRMFYVHLFGPLVNSVVQIVYFLIDYLENGALKSSTIILLLCIFPFYSFSSVQFSRSVVSDSLQPNESQHARPPCPSSTPGVHPNSCPSSRWCHSAISSSVVPFSSCPQSFPASRSFPMSQLFIWGGQSIGVSASESVLQMNT